MTLRVIRDRGSGKKRIAALENDRGGCQVSEFISDLCVKDSKKFGRLIALFDEMRDNGWIENRNKFKRLTDLEDLHEFRSGDIRVTCFIEHTDVVCVNAFVKRARKGKRAQEGYKRALRQRRQWREERRRL